ncbi:tRNA (N6-threonylcarbamoyladenosine(37)-N6)-methyltransferase TrmO [Xylophilus rhododendri]|uniref:tRNA (N6-threonylcarbamoyladenosine(37)-N6)-methyltransferase TrmO n=1 Tax=Xylophilus rhododendri TaxID=2697032 RepID=A0A857J2V4_9BURK|nr:tRNA (N6-threonylcarbamoyladenosine(37)-N6)-methyltransferase TrmO [Xylophilus rhododendri]QHI98096.1 tRNA (N6-threonylcarbamoyladenosine(37)-N6)-methyltransferase TrmO [Xylophilus rhododendri]
MNRTITCQPVAFVRSRFTDKVGMPIQTAGAPAETGRIELLPAFVPGLRDIEGFEYLILLTHLDRGEHEPLEVKPFLDDKTHGVFATRAPARPNRIGLSIVRLERVQGGVLHFSGNDMLDMTPVLDIKPYVPQFDVRQTERIGWFAARVAQMPTLLSDDRMAPPAA